MDNITFVGLDVHKATVCMAIAECGRESPHAASLIVSLTLTVPLGDLVENRKLMVLTVAASVPALLLTGLARNGAMLLMAASLTGLTSVAVQNADPAGGAPHA